MAYRLEESTIKTRYAVCDYCGDKVEHGTEKSFPLGPPKRWVQWGELWLCGPLCAVKMFLEEDIITLTDNFDKDCND